MIRSYSAQEIYKWLVIVRVHIRQEHIEGHFTLRDLTPVLNGLKLATKQLLTLHNFESGSLHFSSLLDNNG